MIYIYKIENLITNKIYIGQTINFNSRKSYHKNFLKYNKHDNPYLQNDYNLYGINSFKFSIIEITQDKEEANRIENYWINYYGGIESLNTYNCKDNIRNNKTMNQRISITKNNQNIKFDSNIRKSIALGHKGEIPWNKDKRMSDEFKKNQSIKVKGKNNPMYGKSSKKKYDEKFVESLKLEYKEIGNIAELARRKNMNEGIVRNLINHGKSYNPDSPYYKRKYKKKEVE